MTASASVIDLWLLADGGAPIGFTLPLSEHILKQWEAGELVRVHADGSPWDEAEDDPDVLAEPRGPAGAEPAEPGGDAVEVIPVRPQDSAHISHWRRYAAAIGACTEDEAGSMKKAELVELVTPPEEKPPDPEA